MSADATSFSTRARSFGSERSALTLFLLRLNSGKKPAPDPISVRVLSPPGGSILMTSAPRSPRIMPQVGPITMCENSITRMPDSGRPALFAADLRAVALRAGRRLVFRAIERSRLSSFCFFCRALGLGAQTERIKAHVNNVCIEIAAAGHGEAHVLLDMHERHAGLPRGNRDRKLVELAHHGLWSRSLLHH